MIFSFHASLSHLAFLDWLGSYLIAFFSCFMSLLDLHGSLPLLVCPRNSTSISFSISFIQSPCSKRCLKSFLWWPCPGIPTLPLASECYSPNLGHKPSTECPKIWMSSNRLWLCPSKTQFIWLGMCHQLAKIDLRPLLPNSCSSLFLPLCVISASY